MEITFELDTSPIGKLGSMPREITSKALFYAAQDMTRFLQTNSPVDHGLLRQWFIESIDDEEAHIKTPAKYAVYVNDGHSQEPGRFIPGRWDGDKFRYDPEEKNGGMVLKAPFVEGDHFVERSFEQLTPLVPGYFLKALEEVHIV